MSKNVILQHRIPARMRELNAFIRLADKLEGAGNVTLKVDAVVFEMSDPRFLLHPLADSAALMARSLLHFLGIGYDAKHDALKAAPWRQGDLSMPDLNLAAVSPTRAVSGWTVASVRADDLLKLCFVTGNKVSAHLTNESAMTTSASIDELREAFQLVTDLINREVFQTLGQDDVTFEPGGAFGSISEQRKST
ncbi:hypothetical protein EOA13_25850 [Mesorhizobium sp. M7A.F.Ca.US.011.01.1.1]|uniref:hypothetical protein n=1 Tax=Mesorhizobium sp. M7A.F.Ca.US.011.01.1.1 TaxID=2496741 RepID=UPI000FCA5C33|nr:hypothetical protein [Mesorhizobium sp. M7A.F.Ca.US.011.01.1.1]RUX25830.1 hypothetical protein EOA13_25850 [Mesorhizobium sp. M7A.F.Ca.US.011.01.1.1]